MKDFNFVPKSKSQERRLNIMKNNKKEDLLQFINKHISTLENDAPEYPEDLDDWVGGNIDDAFNMGSDYGEHFGALDAFKLIRDKLKG